jgi:hypothetical protein
MWIAQFNDLAKARVGHQGKTDMESMMRQRGMMKDKITLYSLENNDAKCPNQKNHLFFPSNCWWYLFSP